MRLVTLQLVVGILLAIVLLVGAILLLRMAPLGYNLMLVYSVISILWTLVLLVLTYTVMLPIQQRVLGNVPEAGVAMALGGVMGTVSTALALIYPVAVLVVLTRPAIRERFSS